jgi:argininosuccinate synthase
LAPFYGNWLHEGQILDPVMRDIEAYFTSSQEQVTGKVFIALQPYHFQILGISSDYDLMSSKFGKYGEDGTMDGRAMMYVGSLRFLVIKQ